MCETLIVKYDQHLYRFHYRVQEIFNNFHLSLEALHTFVNSNEQTTFENDTSTSFQKHFYNSPLYDSFRDVYYAFVKNEIGKLFPGEEYLVVQKDPQFRVHTPNNTALGIKESDTRGEIGVHCDADYNHPPDEINYIIPITEMWDTNSVYMESKPGKKDYAPIRLYQNEFIQFWGNKLSHFNKINISGLTRVSMDIRIIPYSKYDSTYSKRSVHGNRSFIIGDYFIKLKINDSA